MDDDRDPASIADVLERVGLEQDEIDDLVGFDRSERVGLWKTFAGVAVWGEEVPA